MNESIYSREVLRILFNEQKQLDELAVMLMTNAAIRKMTVKGIYELAIDCIIAKRQIEAQHHDAGWEQVKADVKEQREAGAAG